ncbi:MAG: hypothetical protein JWQ59_707 [Cryobacterium sp.]|nr:hypothetical protein [Cryobacterium sp.]
MVQRLDIPPQAGQVIEAASGVALSGLLVRWIASDEKRGTSGIELGRAVTDSDGRFGIPVADTDEARAAAHELVCQGRGGFLALGDPGNEDRELELYRAGQSEDGTLIPVRGEQVRQERWVELASYLATNRMLALDDLAGQLSMPSPDSPTASWTVSERAGALATVARALREGEPDTGGAEPSVALPLLEQNHLVNLPALLESDVVTAVNNYRSLEIFEKYGGNRTEWFDGAFFGTGPGDTELYRDYLRGVWVTAAKRMHGDGVGDEAFETQIQSRFHQNFRTSDAKPVHVHILLVPILRSVLTSATNVGGFGVPAANLPAQGPDTDAGYVDTLVTLSGVPAEELRNRFRVRFHRPNTDTASPIDLNVEALQGLLADTYQSPPEPFPTPLRGLPEPGKPLLFAPWVGRAPFFLTFDEWLSRQRRFFPENVFDIRRAIPYFPKDYRDELAKQKTASHTNVSPDNNYVSDQSDWQASAAWMERIVVISDTIRSALATAEKQTLGDALVLLDAASVHVDEARRAAKPKWTRDSFPWLNYTGAWNAVAERRISLKARSARPVTSPQQLAEFETYFDTRPTPHVYSWQNAPGPDFPDWQESWLARARTLYLNELRYFEHVLIPYLRATIAGTRGDHAGAIRLFGSITGYDVGIARVTDAAGYPPKETFDSPKFYRSDALPYTTGVVFDPDTDWYTDHRPHSTLSPTQGAQVGPIPEPERPIIAPFEHRFFKLAQGDEMLAWADELYRTDEPAEIRRARELYKGVLFLHGEDPAIAPHFATGISPLPFGGPFGFQLKPGGQDQNPAKTSQLARARAAYWQIDEGLNAYGYRNDLVPVLRYRPLKQSADLFAASAKSSQSDYLQYQIRFESAVIEGWQTAAMVKKAEAGGGIAAQQIEIAKSGVAKAQEQVTLVKAQIDAKKKEIADAGSFFSQASDFFSGMKDSLSGMVSLAEKSGNDTSPAGGSPTTEQLLALASKSTQGASASSDAAAAALGSGAAMTLGFAAFAYYGYTTMGSMAEAYAKRDGELKTLQTGTLAAAEAQVALKERDVSIAKFGQQIAQAELDLARTLDRYQRERFLNVDLWNKLATFAQRTMRRYIELGARFAWFAERALAFEQNRELDIIRLNYVPTALRGLTGADRLLLDLAELEATRLQGVRLTAPVKQTLSLARDFPIAFGALKKTGRCTFHTRERELKSAFPGTFGYRVRAITVSAMDADGAPPRGILRNVGVSSVSAENGTAAATLTRYPDALPLSEFSLHNDLWVYGLPGETLMQFEGSGFETDWELEFPAVANPKGLRSLTDVLITCDMNAMYSQRLAMLEAAAPSPPVTRSVALAASVWDPKGLATLAAPTGTVSIRLDLRKLAFPAQETNRTIANLAVILVGTTNATYAAELRAVGSGTQVAFTVTGGVALSNAGVLLGAAPALPLNALVSLPVDQVLEIRIDRTGVEEELAALSDVVLYVEYTADL